MSPALAGRFFTTVPPREAPELNLEYDYRCQLTTQLATDNIILIPLVLQNQKSLLLLYIKMIYYYLMALYTHTHTHIYDISQFLDDMNRDRYPRAKEIEKIRGKY